MRQTWDADPGQHINDFAMELLALAKRQNSQVVGRHNARIMIAKPDYSEADMLGEVERVSLRVQGAG